MFVRLFRAEFILSGRPGHASGRRVRAAAGGGAAYYATRTLRRGRLKGGGLGTDTDIRAAEAVGAAGAVGGQGLSGGRCGGDGREYTEFGEQQQELTCTCIHQTWSKFRDGRG